MKKLLDSDGENKAVRSFLMMYGAQSITVGQMQKHLQCSGWSHWPDWVPNQLDSHLTKAGAQDWLRHLFGLEKEVLQS